MSDPNTAVEGQVLDATDSPDAEAPLSFKDLLARYAAIHAFEGAIRDYSAAAKGHVFARMRAKQAEDGTKSFNVMIDGEKVAGATITDPKGSVKVSDPDALLEWVEQNFPTEVETVSQVRPSFETALKKRVKPEDEGLIDPDTGELVPGLTWNPPGEATTFSVNSWKQGAKDQLLDGLFDQLPKQLHLPAGGSE